MAITVTLDRMIHIQATHAALDRHMGVAGDCADVQGRHDLNPVDLLGVSVGSCLLIVMAKGAKARNIDVTGSWAQVRCNVKDYVIVSIDVTVHSPCDPSADDRVYLEQESHHCPVYQALKNGVAVGVTFHWASHAQPVAQTAGAECCGGETTQAEASCCAEAKPIKGGCGSACSLPAAAARYVVVGGFLGAGKTSAILKLAAHIERSGRRAGLITNDQTGNLVDTARARAAGFAVEEIGGGCFCCKFDSLLDAAKTLTRQTAPDVFIAEPVGSCTDLKSTVTGPLRQIYGSDCQIAPLSVLVDPLRAARMLGLSEQGNRFSKNVVYVYRKQLEEADILVVNKIDLIDARLQAELVAALNREFPLAKVVEISTRSGEGIEQWIDLVLSSGPGLSGALELDRDRYAQAEASLGWFSGRVELRAQHSFDGNVFLVDFASAVRERLADAGVPIGHLKLTLAPDSGPDLGAVSVSRSEEPPQFTHRLADELSNGVLTINVRAQADPSQLREAVAQSVSKWSGLNPALRPIIAAAAQCGPPKRSACGGSQP